MEPRLFEGDFSRVGPQGELYFDGIDLGRLARELDRPFFLLSERVVEHNYARLARAFAAITDFAVYYSVKTNFETEVLRTLWRLGAGAEVSGELDLSLARRAGFEPRQIVFDGPCKGDRELRLAAEQGIRLINAESVDELRRLDALARALDRPLDVGVRIDPMDRRPYYDKLITTYKKKFGFHIGRCREAFDAVRACRSLRLVGLNAHIGSQILAPGLYVEALDALFRLAADLRREGFPIGEINIGGGFPAQSIRNLRLSRRMLGAGLLERLGGLEKPTPAIADFGRLVTRCYDANARRYGFTPRLAIEPGRSLVNNACVLVGRVRLLKPGWVFTDISVNDVPANLFFAEWRVFFPGKVGAPEVARAHISGPTLSTYDVLFFEKGIPALEPGDPVVIYDTGGYSISRANQFTRPRNAVYFVTRSGELRLIRRAETVDDVMAPLVWAEPAPAHVEPGEVAAVASVRS